MIPETAQLVTEANRLSGKIDEGVKALHAAAKAAAHAEHDYRLRKGLLWAQAPDGTAASKVAWVDAESAGERLTRDLAEAEKLAALEALRSRRQQLSSLQTIVNAERAEAEFARVRPDAA